MLDIVSEFKRRRQILEAINSALALQQEIGLELDRLSEKRDALLDKVDDLLELYEKEFPSD